MGGRARPGGRDGSGSGLALASLPPPAGRSRSRSFLRRFLACSLAASVRPPLVLPGEPPPPRGREGCRCEEARGLGRDGDPSLLPPAAAPVSSGGAGSVGAEGGPGLRSAPAAGLGAMERVQMINIQRLLEAAEYLERRERGNGGRRGAGTAALPGGERGWGQGSPRRGESGPGQGGRSELGWWAGAVRGLARDGAGRSRRRRWLR